MLVAERHKEKEMKKKLETWKVEVTPIREEDGVWVMHFGSKGEKIGTVQVFDDYTKSGWADEVPVDVRRRLEDLAVEHYRALMANQILEMVLAQMAPGSTVAVVPIDRGAATTGGHEDVK